MAPQNHLKKFLKNVKNHDDVSKFPGDILGRRYQDKRKSAYTCSLKILKLRYIGNISNFDGTVKLKNLP